MSSFEYYNTLTGDIKWRYDQKIQICNNIDPYKLAPGDCTLSICDIPNVTIVDLMNYLVLSHSFYTGQQFKSMKSLQAYKFAESGAVLSILAKKVNEEAFVVVCKVRHSQRFREKPLDTWVILLKDGSVSSAHCSCMAGLGEACSHIATVLFYLHFRPGTTDQSRLACTEVLSAWPVPPVKSGSMVPVSEMVWSQQEKPVTSKELNCSMDAQETESFLRKLIDAGISPAICRLMDPFASEMEKKEVVDLPDTYDSWYNANLKNKTYEDLLEMCKRMYISVTEKHIENIEFHTKDQSQSSIWFKYRAGEHSIKI